MTDAEIADLYKRWFLCITKHMKPFGVAAAMKRFALANPDVTYSSWIARKYVRHTLWYKKIEIYSLEV